MFLYSAFLFFILAPGVLLALPPGGSCMEKAAFHAVVFAIAYQMTHKAVWRMCNGGMMY
jgi:hypothetical protein